VILNKTFDFSRYQKIADHVKKHTKAHVLSFYDKYVAANAPCRQKLCVHVVAKQHEVAPEAGEKASENGNTVAGKTKINASEVICIDDPVEFRRSMPLYSMPAKVNVDVVALEINRHNDGEITGATDGS